MEFNTQTILILGALGLGAYALTRKSEPQYFVPGRGWTDASLLPSLGFQEIPVGSGQWYSQQQINWAAGQAGVPPGTTVDPTSSTFATISAILANIVGLIPQVTNVVNAINKPQKIQEILNKYTVPVSLYYNANFPYNQQQLEQMTTAQLTQILNTGSLS